MNKLHSIISKRWFIYGAASVVLAIIAPTLCHLFSINKAHRILWLFLIINSLFALWCGIDVKRHLQRRLYLLIFPVLFLLYALVRYNYYVYFLALLYLGLSYLGYGLTQKSSPVKKRD